MWNRYTTRAYYIYQTNEVVLLAINSMSAVTTVGVTIVIIIIAAI